MVKGDRDFSAIKPTTKIMQAIVWTGLILMLLGMLLYILLFAWRQTESRQQNWFDTFIVWLVVEILITSTNACLITHVVIPSVTIGDSTKIKLKLIEAIKKYQENVHKIVESGIVPALNEENNDTIFDASKHFFVSARVAKKYSSLREAQIISMFRTPWPRQLYGERLNQTMSYGMISVIVRAVTVMIVFVLNTYLHVDVIAQDILVEWFTHFLAYWVARFFIMLWNISPVLAFFPLVILVIVAHFFFNTRGSYTHSQLMRLRDMTVQFLPRSPRSKSPGKRSPKDGKTSPTYDALGSYKSVEHDATPLDEFADDANKIESPLFSKAVRKILENYSEDELDQMVNEGDDPRIVAKKEFDEETKDQERKEDEYSGADGGLGLHVSLPVGTDGSSGDENDVPVRPVQSRGSGRVTCDVSPAITASVSRSPGPFFNKLNNTSSNRVSNNRAAGSILSDSGSDEASYTRDVQASNQAAYVWSESGNRSLTSCQVHNQFAPYTRLNKYQLSSDDGNNNNNGDDSSDELDDRIALLPVHHLHTSCNGGDESLSEYGENRSVDVQQRSESIGNKGIRVGILQQVQQKRRLNDVNDDPFFEQDVEQPAVVSTSKAIRKSSSSWYSRINFGSI